MNKKEIFFFLNDREIHTQHPSGSILVDFIRGDQHLIGTHIACREGDCGACSVLLGVKGKYGVNYRTVASCLLPLGDVDGCHVVTIEGLNQKELTPVQKVFVSERASQCGFCTPGMVISLTDFLLNSSQLLEDDAITAIEGNICRCTGYMAIRRAIKRLLSELRPKLLSAGNRLEVLTALGVVPDYFTRISARLKTHPATAIKDIDVRNVLVLAGGTDITIQRAGELIDNECFFLSGQKEFSSIWIRSESIYIGAAVSVTELMVSSQLLSVLPELYGALRLVSSRQVRNRATVGGNIVNASPIGDLSVIFLALDAFIGLQLGHENREIPLREFFLGYKKVDLRVGELLAWIRIPMKGRKILFHFEKVSRRKHQDIASVNSAISAEMDGNIIKTGHVSVGGVAGVPLYLKKTSAFLSSKMVSAELLRTVVSLADKEIEPISDVRGSNSYKRSLLKRLLFAHFLVLFPNCISCGDMS